jgi:hypothetical protein
LFPYTSLVNLFRDINRCKRNFHNVAISKRNLQISSWINISVTFLKIKVIYFFNTEHSQNHNCSLYGYSIIHVRNRNIFGGEPQWKRPLGRPRYRWKDPIKMYLKEIGPEGMDWINLAQEKASGGLLWRR